MKNYLHAFTLLQKVSKCIKNNRSSKTMASNNIWWPSKEKALGKKVEKIGKFFLKFDYHI